MKVINCPSKNLERRIQQFVQDYDTSDLTCKFEPKGRVLGNYRRMSTTITIFGTYPEIEHFATFAHEFRHYLQDTRKICDFRNKERDAQEYECWATNKEFGVDWKLDHAQREVYYSVKEKRKYLYRPKYHRILKRDKT